MSSPFILWTLQRTGGTNLFNLLVEMSTHSAAEHEPFNFDRRQPRQFAKVYLDWRNNRDVSALHEICAKRVLIKHVYEWFDNDFNSALSMAADKYSYRHVHLLRRDSVARLISKGVAEESGAWYPDYAQRIFPEVLKGQRQIKLDVGYLVRKHEIAERKRSNVTRMHRARQRYFTVFYEDLYMGSIDDRMAALTALTTFLHIDRNRLDDYQSVIDTYLINGGQNTSAMLPHIAGIEELRRALELKGEAFS
jgi:hypothetical protein